MIASTVEGFDWACGVPKDLEDLPAGSDFLALW